MKYQRKVQTVDAVQLKQHTTITTAQGKMHGDVGDYLVTEGGQQRIVEKAEFEREWQQTYDYSVWGGGYYIQPYQVQPCYLTWNGGYRLTLNYDTAASPSLIGGKNRSTTSYTDGAASESD